MPWAEKTLNGFPTIQLSGDIDLANSPALRKQLQSKLENQHPVLFIDFSGVTYIDSSGLATLIEYYKESRSFDGTLSLYGLSPRVKSVFELVRLTEILNLHDDLESATEAHKHS